MSIPLPSKVSITPLEKHQAQIAIEPCYPGYGMTIGNTLRRVLLASLEGSAVVAVRIHNAPHEFTTLPFVKEDALELVLNVKNLRIKILGDQEEVKLTVRHKGEGKVKAGDITPDSGVEIMNPELVLATVTDDSVEFEMDLFVRRGRGFDAIESRGKGREEIGVIDVDAIFSPVRAVSLKTERVRVGQMTNWDRVLLDVTTDGSLTPEEAFDRATKILFDHFQYLVNYKELAKVEVVEAEVKTEEVPGQVSAEEEKPKEAEVPPEGEQKEEKKKSKKKKTS
ncbi:MAG TPA: DNA-directed RNA polymerase subunit alpha [Patescibacteria group bacterium]|nr:DNA-directed RNA polymerase subunit alpha [Patescibacteria group bacterium]